MYSLFKEIFRVRRMVMSRKKLAVPWILFGITAIVCIALTVIIVVQDKEPSEQPASQNTRGLIAEFPSF